MLNRTVLFSFILSASLAFGQLDSNSVTVTAIRSANLQPDQVVFSVAVDSGTSATLTDVLAAVQGIGITSANFSGVSTAPALCYAVVVDPGSPIPQTQTLHWLFALPVSLSKIKDTITSLSNLQQSLIQKNSALKLSFSVQGTQVSPQTLQSQNCAAADLIADARAQAQKLTDAAGMVLGGILAMSSSTANTTTSMGATAPASLAGLLSVSAVLQPSLYYAQNCSLTVKFALVRF